MAGILRKLSTFLFLKRNMKENESFSRRIKAIFRNYPRVYALARAQTVKHVTVGGIKPCKDELRVVILDA